MILYSTHLENESAIESGAISHLNSTGFNGISVSVYT